MGINHVYIAFWGQSEHAGKFTWQRREYSTLLLYLPDRNYSEAVRSFAIIIFFWWNCVYSGNEFIMVNHLNCLSYCAGQTWKIYNEHDSLTWNTLNIRYFENLNSTQLYPSYLFFDKLKYFLLLSLSFMCINFY